MDADRHAGRLCRDHRVDEFDIAQRQRIRVLAAVAHRQAHFLVTQIGEVGVVELDIGTAGFAERLQFVRIDLDHVVDINVEIGIGGFADRAAPAAQQHGRRRNGGLGGSPRRRLQELEAVDLDVASVADLADDLELRRLKGLTRRVGVGRATEHRRHAIDPAEKIEMERRAAEFAVGDGFEADRFLKRHSVANVFVFKRAQLRGVEFAVEKTGTRLA